MALFTSIPVPRTSLRRSDEYATTEYSLLPSLVSMKPVKLPCIARSWKNTLTLADYKMFNSIKSIQISIIKSMYEIYRRFVIARKTIKSLGNLGWIQLKPVDPPGLVNQTE